MKWLQKKNCNNHSQIVKTNKLYCSNVSQREREQIFFHKIFRLEIKFLDKRHFHVKLERSLVKNWETVEIRLLGLQWGNRYSNLWNTTVFFVSLKCGDSIFKTLIFSRRNLKCGKNYFETNKSKKFQVQWQIMLQKLFFPWAFHFCDICAPSRVSFFFFCQETVGLLHRV